MDSKVSETKKGKLRDPTSSRGRQPPDQQIQTANYIATMCGELATMANEADLGLTGHFLAMAKAEAESIAERVAK